MKVLKWICWLGAPLYAAISGGYAIAFAGYGLSLWKTKPEPDSMMLAASFAFAAAWAINDAVRNWPARTPQESGRE